MKLETIRACSIWRALEVVGDVGVLLLVERAFLGTRQFDAFVAETGLSRSVVADRLKRLVEEECLAKSGGRRGYHLTDKGRGLFPIALAMLRWQHLWADRTRAWRVELFHEGCSGPVEPIPACGACHAPIDPREVDWAPGPGLAQVLPDYRRRRRLVPGSNGRTQGSLVDPVIELFGDRWATLVVRALFTGIHRFDEIQKDTGMASNILSDRIERLQDQAIITARPYSRHAGRFDYHLSAKGRDLYPVILGLLNWGDRWYADAEGPPLLLTHRPCGAGLEMTIGCSGCGGELTLASARFRITPMG